MISTENIKSSLCTSSCTPIQILTLDMPVNDISSIVILNDCKVQYDIESLKYAYSIDGICWSCYMLLNEAVSNTLNEISDFFVRIKVPGPVSSVKDVNGNELSYSVSLDSEFQLDSTTTSQYYNPYANIDGALKLQTALADMVTNTIGLPIYYFKASGVETSADLTFKEYALKNIISVKQIKLVVPDGTMPSSRPEFTDIGLDWQTDWETEISKSEFATAFGINAQPQEGDLVYIPMMKRMWSVVEAYDEKNGSLMWQSTTFRVMLAKYQADASMDLGDTQAFVNDLVKNKYDDLFGQDNYSTDVSGINSVNTTAVRSTELYPVFRSDAIRKEMSCDKINIINSEIYHKGTLVTEDFYKFLEVPSYISYQQKICGNDISISFIIRPENSDYSGVLLTLSNELNINIQQSDKTSIISYTDKLKVEIDNNNFWLVTLRLSEKMRTADITASKLMHPENIPLYKLTKYHYYFDIDHRKEVTEKWNVEMNINNDVELQCNGLYGMITNIKVFDVYNDSMSELLQQYPTNAHLRINDTARPLLGLLGTTKA